MTIVACTTVQPVRSGSVLVLVFSLASEWVNDAWRERGSRIDRFSSYNLDTAYRAPSTVPYHTVAIPRLVNHIRRHFRFVFDRLFPFVFFSREVKLKTDTLATYVEYLLARNYRPMYRI